MRKNELGRCILAPLALVGLLLIASCGGGSGGDGVQTSASQSPWVGLWNAIQLYDPAIGQWQPVADMVDGATTSITLEVTSDRITVTITSSSTNTITVSCAQSGTYNVNPNNLIMTMTYDKDDCDGSTAGKSFSTTLEFRNDNNTMITNDPDGFLMEFSRL